MQKMASNKHASFGSGEKLLRCAGSLFLFLGLSLLPGASQPRGTATPALGDVHCPASNPCPQLSITLWVQRGFHGHLLLCLAH